MYYQCWMEVTKQTRYRDKWLTDETYFRAMKAQFPSLNSLDFNRGVMNRAIAVCGGGTLDDFTSSNSTGIFRRKAKGTDPYDNQKRTVWGYYVTTPGGLVARPPDGTRSFLSLLQDETINDRYSIARGLSEVVDLTKEIHVKSRAKRRAEAVDIAAAAIAETAANKRGKPSTDAILESAAAVGSASAQILLETYWDSPEAKKLFLGNSTDGRSVIDVLKQRIQRLQQVNRTQDGWRDLVDKHDIDNLCSAYDVFIIRQRCSILCIAYIFALEEMNSVRWVEDCCSQAIYDSGRMGIEAAATTERTVAEWNILLRANREHFPLPDPKILNHKKPLPNLLEYYREEITLPWIGFCVKNLADLTVEMARHELITNIIPKAFEKKGNGQIAVNNNQDAANEPEQQQEIETIRDCLLQGYIESPISISTSWRWLRRLGFGHDRNKKSFLSTDTRDLMLFSIAMSFVQTISPNLNLECIDGSR